ncbi:MAG: UDP-glucose/GDP-mannose dehydrogenase family protein [Parcubacteria group bacterium]|nr:UDP-glucose/GDP-mannose dehydrogenase family protein [Parcubacteria group bacterium]
MKVGIMGVGMVGGAVARVFKDPILYDPHKGLGSLKEVNQADAVFICVPTPYDEEKGGFDLSIVREAVNGLLPGKIVVIKSTVLPGTTELLQKEYPQQKFIFNPEFLTEETADQDMRYPDRQIVGYTKESYSIAGDFMQILPLASFERILPATEAEMVKYFSNTWFGTKVVFANQMYDICEALGIDYDRVKDATAADKRIGRSHLTVFHKGYRGYGGKCIPKDTRALIQKAHELGVDIGLLERVEEINNKLVALPVPKEKTSSNESFNNNAKS